MKAIILALVAVAVTACGAAPVPTTLGADGPSRLTIVQNGGCFMMGPNCPTWTLQADGNFTVGRTGETGMVAEGQIDPAGATELWNHLVATDFEALVDRLGPGSCQGCVDGIDTVVEFDLGDETVTLDSTQVEFSPSEPLFVLLGEAIEEMSEVAPLPVTQR